MISITDTRYNDNIKELKDIWPGDFFYYEGDLYRRIDCGGMYKIEPLDADAIFVVDMKSGYLMPMHREMEVEYIPSEQIEIIIGD